MDSERQTILARLEDLLEVRELDVDSRLTLDLGKEAGREGGEERREGKVRYSWVLCTKTQNQTVLHVDTPNVGVVNTTQLNQLMPGIELHCNSTNDLIH